MLLSVYVTDLSDSLDAFFASLGWPLEAMVRLAFAAIAGAAVGLEREVRVKHAGFRTMLLVCLGSALVMIVSIRIPFGEWPELGGNNEVSIDPSRIAYGIMTGIGFLGAGTIIERRGATRGLTTAAAIWCVAAVGMAAGFGLYLLAAATTILVIVALWLLDYVEGFIPVRRQRELTLRTRYRPDVAIATVARLKRFPLSVRSISMDRRADPDFVELTVLIAYNDANDYLKFESEIDGGECQVLRSREI